MYITVETAAKKLDVSIYNIYYALAFGLIEAVCLRGRGPVGDCWRIWEKSLYAYDERRRGRIKEGATGTDGNNYLGPLFEGRLQNGFESYYARRPQSKKITRRVDNSPKRCNKMDARQLELIM